MIRSTGFVTQINTPSTGWYKVSLSHAPQTEVSGVSLKNTAFTVGQQVIVFQYGSWGSGLNEFGFTELPTDISSPLALRGQIQLIPSAFEFVAKNSPAQTCAAYIALANDNKKLRYFPATITAISGGFLRCKDYFDKDLGLIRLKSGLTLSDFSVGDRVLINTFFNGTVEVLGFWQTVPDSDGYWQLGLIGLRHYLWNPITNESVDTGVDYDSDYNVSYVAQGLYYKNKIPYMINEKQDYSNKRIVDLSAATSVIASIDVSGDDFITGYTEWNSFSGYYESHIFESGALAYLTGLNTAFSESVQALDGGFTKTSDLVAFLQNGSRFNSGYIWDKDNVFIGTIPIDTGFDESIFTGGVAGLNTDGNSIWGYKRTDGDSDYKFIVKDSAEMVEYETTDIIFTNIDSQVRASGHNQADEYLFLHNSQNANVVIFNKTAKTFSSAVCPFDNYFPGINCSFVKKESGIS